MSTYWGNWYCWLVDQPCGVYNIIYIIFIVIMHFCYNTTTYICSVQNLTGRLTWLYIVNCRKFYNEHLSYKWHASLHYVSDNLTRSIRVILHSLYIAVSGRVGKYLVSCISDATLFNSNLQAIQVPNLIYQRRTSTGSDTTQRITHKSDSRKYFQTNSGA